MFRWVCSGRWELNSTGHWPSGSRIGQDCQDVASGLTHENQQPQTWCDTSLRTISEPFEQIMTWTTCGWEMTTEYSLFWWSVPLFLLFSLEPVKQMVRSARTRMCLVSFSELARIMRVDFPRIPCWNVSLVGCDLLHRFSEHYNNV